jgi:hypothetical protein
MAQAKAIFGKTLAFQRQPIHIGMIPFLIPRLTASVRLLTLSLPSMLLM